MDYLGLQCPRLITSQPVGFLQRGSEEYKEAKANILYRTYQRAIFCVTWDGLTEMNCLYQMNNFLASNYFH